METILIVDDEDMVNRLVRASLETEGYTVLEATTGEEALEIATRYTGEIQLLITNHVLRRSTGREVAERLHVFRPGMKVLHISGHNRQTLEAEGTLTPGSLFVQKPFMPKDLRAKVRAILDQK